MSVMQSARIQCCTCAVSVLSSIIGILMVSTGVCLVLNYGLIEVDTSGLPPQWHNEEGKKIVGIILICVGCGAIGLSALISILYYTVCSRPKPQIAAIPITETESNSSSKTKHKNRPKNRTVQELKNSARVTGAQNLAPPTNSRNHTKRYKRKGNYQSKLPTHKEENVTNVVVRYHDGITTIENGVNFSQNNNNNNNNSVDSARSNTSSNSSCDSDKNPIVIQVSSLPNVEDLPIPSTSTATHSYLDTSTLDDDIAKLVV